jgi:hypothetical protein
MTSKKFLDPETTRIVLDLHRRGYSRKRIIEFYARNFGSISSEVIGRILFRDRLFKRQPSQQEMQSLRDTQSHQLEP